jgi:hypothetical protein
MMNDFSEQKTYRVVSQAGDTYFVTARDESQARQEAYRLCIPSYVEVFEEL